MFFCDGTLRAATGEVILATWKVEGLTETKLEELQVHMCNLSIEGFVHPGDTQAEVALARILCF